ncbi:arsenate reductase [Halorhodospira halochloris]|uniref:Arsenate reductase n=1 Tax=Halorhodospira halochloris TaxID=1052 RepID=A0A125T2T6_HALHR|nr:arsenate reductase ArsC [Halorhodospira halochloris]MBK1652775.1 arsenate reductase [Halorhodospira halochloris]BAU58898.1 arsenate reductase [Halorhodospira halochloris]
MSEKKRVLFLCTGNSCRSQMAEGFAKTLGTDPSVEIMSAGLDAQGLNPMAIKVMQEDGVDISSQESTTVTEEMVASASLIITLCDHADANCPAAPATAEHRHWPIADPAQVSGSDAEVLAAFRDARDEIKDYVFGLVNDLRSGEEF